MEERINIIKSFKSIFQKSKKGIQSRIQTLKGFTFISALFSVLCFCLTLYTIILEQFKPEISKWENMGLLVVMSLMFILMLNNTLIELKLLKHLQNIQGKTNFNGINQLNLELKNIVEKLNKRDENDIIWIGLAIVIIISGSYQQLSETGNPYWEYTKIPVLLFWAIMISKFVVSNKKISENIKETEKQIIN